MIPEIGHYALILALAMALVQAAAAPLGARFRDGGLMALAQAGCGGAVRLHLGRAGLPDAGLRRLRLLGRDGRRQLPLGQAAALQVHRHMGQSRRLDAALGLDSRGLRRRRGGLRAQPAAGVPGLGAGRAGPDRSRLSGLHCRHLQPLPQARPRAVRRARSQPAAAGSRASHSTRRCSISAMSGSRRRSPSPWRR